MTTWDVQLFTAVKAGFIDLPEDADLHDETARSGVPALGIPERSGMVARPGLQPHLLAH